MLVMLSTLPARARRVEQGVLVLVVLGVRQAWISLQPDACTLEVARIERLEERLVLGPDRLALRRHQRVQEHVRVVPSEAREVQEFLDVGALVGSG